MKNGAEMTLNGEIILSGYVMADADAAWAGDSGFICPQMVREALAAVSGPVTMRMSSDGGDPFAGEAIRAAMVSHPGGVTMVIEGMAASAASLILMGASKRIMSEGSMLMIHDPSTLSWGTEDELRKMADVTGQIAMVYANVYAKAAGISADDARAIMRAETYFSAQDAVDAGFADEVVGQSDVPVTQEAVKSAFMNMRQGMTALMARKNSGQPEKPAAAGGSPAIPAISKETEMSKETPAAVATATTPIAATMAAPDGAALIAAERNRVKEIREMVRPFMGQIPETDVDAMIDEGTSPQAASQRILALMAAHAAPTSVARVTRDETETQMEGMIEALMGKFDGPGAQFRGLTMKKLAMHLAGPKRGFNDVETVRAGMVSTRMAGGALGSSDFSYITANVMNRNLRLQYQRNASSWTKVAAAPLMAADFRNLVMVRFGGDTQLQQVLANGEYANTTLNDEGDTLSVQRRGRAINLTFEAIINDDMNALSRLPGEFAMAAQTMENSMVWSLIRNNSALTSDSTALFHANHKNLAGTGTVISATSVALGRKAMWEQRALGVKDSDDFIYLSPDTLLVPPAIELAAKQFVSPTLPTQDSVTNPFKGSMEVVVVPNLGAQATGGSDIAWYMVSSMRPPVSVAYLDGYDAPTITAAQTLNPDLMTYNARHIFGAANTEWRGAYKNPGA